MEQAILDIEANVQALLAQHTPRPAEGALGLECVRRELQPRTVANGNVQRRYSFNVHDVALSALYPERDASWSWSPVLFKVTLSDAGEARFNNFTTSYFPKLKAAWCTMIAAEAKLAAGAALPAHLQTPNSWRHLETLMGHFAVALGEELAELNLADTPVTRARLISVRMALGGSVLRGPSVQEALSPELGQWLAADIELPVLLYAFNSGGGYWRHKQTGPLVPFEDAKELAGVPLARIKALYPQEEPPARNW